ncbi:hypothetical protein [Pseudomonas sp. P8_241]|uniref:hypothetical protein n=1 Tax=Pseudomonas sp. P8_241 TaxID=3043445 RepID=UPI002A35AB3D|nr:hypothetical protein [Pseudomonas sp. P8_241]WPN47505.1 hypothetical protein QMK58_02155 [Pseudomonas sp. P8_241]
MGAAIDFLHRHGIFAKAKGERIVVSPKSQLTDDVRQFVRTHRLELLAELAENDQAPRLVAWRITRNGKTICMMIGEPITNVEALEIAHWHWPDAGVTPIAAAQRTDPLPNLWNVTPPA